MENLTGGTPPVRYLLCVVPCKLYFNREEATILRMHHFEGYAWKAIAKKCHMSVRTMMRVRETAYHTLEECYSKAQECGIISIE